MKYIFLLLITNILISCENSQSNKINNSKSAILYIKQMVRNKVNYEEASFFKNLPNTDKQYYINNNMYVSKNSDSLRNIYFLSVKYFKLNRCIFIKYINYEIKDNFKNKNSNLITFKYQPELSSYLGKCTYLKYEDLLNLMLYNLTIRDDTTLICWEDDSKVF